MLPDVNSTGVILQGAVIVTFDQEIDVTTYDENSFLLSAPAETPRVPPGGLVGYVAPVIGTGVDRGDSKLLTSIVSKGILLVTG